MSVEALKDMGRAGLIEEATRRLREQNPDFDPTAYDRVVVRASSTDVLVSFTTSIVLLRTGESFTHSRSIGLVSGLGSGGSVANPHDLTWTGTPPPFLPDPDTVRDIRFVLEAANRDTKVGDIPDGKLPEGTRMTIRDVGDHYEVSVESEWIRSSYRVAKGTGAISEAMHAHSVAPEFEEAEVLELITE